MGTDAHVRLVDQDLLREVRHAIESFVESGNASTAIPLVLAASQRIELTDDTTEGQIAKYLLESSLGLLHGELPAPAINDENGHPVTEARLIRQYQAERTLVRLLVFILSAVPVDGLLDPINMTRDDIADYVRTRSRWLDEAFSLSNDLLWKAESLTPSFGLGHDAWLLTSREAGRVLKEIQSIPAPPDIALSAKYRRLEHLFVLATGSTERRVLVTMA